MEGGDGVEEGAAGEEEGLDDHGAVGVSCISRIRVFADCVQWILVGMK